MATNFNYSYRVSDTTDCWLWTGKLTSKGYAGNCGGYARAHVYSYWRFNGPIPQGYDVHHICEVKICVNPEHLVALTHEDHLRLRRKEFCSKGHIKDYYRKDKDTWECSICKHPNSKPWIEHQYCKRGHPFGPLDINKNGRRECKICRKALKRTYSRGTTVEQELEKRGY